MKATRISVLTLFLGVSGHAAAQNLYLPYRVITPHRATTHHQAATSHRTIRREQIVVNPNLVRHKIRLNPRPCPAGWRLAAGSWRLAAGGWRLASGNAAGAYTCKRTTAPRCAAGYRLKRGACKNPVGGIDLSSTGPGECTYQCIPEKPKFKPKCAKHFMPIVGACEVGCTPEIY